VTAVNHRHRPAHRLRCHIVEQHRVDPEKIYGLECALSAMGQGTNPLSREGGVEAGAFLAVAVSR